MVIKAPNHLPNATEMTTCRNGVETSRQNTKWSSYSSQIFNSLLFFVIQDCVNPRKALFYPKVSLGINFP